MDELVLDQISIFRLTVRRQTHYFVFTGVDLEPGVIGKGGVKEAQGVREVDFLYDFELLTVSYGQRSCRPFTDTIKRQHSRPFKRRWIEGTRRVR